PGDYEVRTGLYDVTTLERAAVQDSAGQPVQDNSILLGSITFAPDAALEAALADARPTGICYAVSASHSLNGAERDTLVRVDNMPGVTVEIGPTGGIEMEGITSSAARALLYGVDEREEYGQFGVIAPAHGVMTEIGAGQA